MPAISNYFLWEAGARVGAHLRGEAFCMAKIRKESFGKLSDGREAFLYTLRNTKGTEAAVTTYGARLAKWRKMTAAGTFVDVVLGYDTAADYEKDCTSMGGIVGRHANRIADGKVTIGGKTYQLDRNDGSRKQNHIHGGTAGFHNQLWDAEETETGVKFTLVSPDGAGGYPGTMHVAVIYGLSNDNELSISYEATCDQDTVINLTNHTYFNLDGYASGPVLDQSIQIFADRYTWADSESLPDGRILEVAGTPMDLRALTRIGAHIDDDFDELRMGHGYDHNWVLRGDPADVELKPGMFGFDIHCPIDYNDGGLHKAAYAEAAKTGLTLMCYTTQPGIQFYTGNFLKGEVGKGGTSFARRSGFCLETQYFPNAFAHPNFPQPVLKAGETWKAQTVFVLGDK